MSSTGLLSKGIELQVKGTGDTYTAIPDLQSIPDLMPSVEKVDVTTLADGSKRYIGGIKDYGDLTFTFLYDNSAETSSFRVCKGLEGAVKSFKVVFPDDTEFAFDGSLVAGTKSVGVNGALTFDAKITLNSEIATTNPTA